MLMGMTQQLMIHQLQLPPKQKVPLHKTSVLGYSNAGNANE
jgi:hypothetical protein